jgi:hypothetical protein
MKRILALALLTTAITAAPANAEILSKLEQSFVVNMIAGVIAVNKCGAQVVDGGMARLGDKIGVDGDRLSAAIQAAVAAQGNLPYDRDALIPAVTTLSIEASNAMSNDIGKNKAKACTSFLKILRENGVVE